ncbi:bifunctional metallophosphatase/5'-nucleotidase [Microtetraspora sp. NBRC 13810]|uniref:bifunctional metallophosphatase/5'-nucleotidase n=1 Tax=Microtetraspora sp. NBRC 13810 TaxID=3030990 RepID=UPI0024A094D5|nr:bifunctional metallophosphatase/5'-nucleotidase [Microtetraspora sp. NBRC 13810]GLW10343.1 bifunctional metallophosphatase/5'-nucleotidase [Microtetraspora sp. NBRC 13810]
MTPRTKKRLAIAGLAAATCIAVAVGPPATAATTPAATTHGKPGKPAKTVPVRLIAINDFHGNLEAPTGSSGRIVNESGQTVNAGGAAFMATHLKRMADRNTVIVGAGDLIGASPLISAAFHDEPTVELLGKLGLDVSSVGNHEFDEGYKELLRISNGGCHPVDGCTPAGRWHGAKYDYVGANVRLKKAPELPALAPFSVKKINGVKVGFIGLVTKSTPSIVTSEGIKDLTFVDEVEAANRTSKALKLLGVKAQVVLVHEGDQIAPNMSPDACPVIAGAGTRIAQGVSADVDLVVMGHSHQAYVCKTKDPAGQDRYVTQGSSFGRVLTQFDFQVDTSTDDVVRSSVVADNHVVTRDVPADEKTTEFVDDWIDRVADVADRQVGTITADITRQSAPSGETPLGNLIADAQLESTKTGGNAEIALMNPGGVRADLTVGSDNGVVTYGDAFTVQPFNNLMQVVTLTGAQLDALLEQQYQVNRTLAPSASLGYTVSASAPVGSKVSDIKINGTPVTDAQQIRVAANNFLVGGGDGFTVFTQGTDLWSGQLDIDAFVDYLGAHTPTAPPATNRITRVP